MILFDIISCSRLKQQKKKRLNLISESKMKLFFHFYCHCFLLKLLFSTKSDQSGTIYSRKLKWKYKVFERKSFQRQNSVCIIQNLCILYHITSDSKLFLHHCKVNSPSNYKKKASKKRCRQNSLIECKYFAKWFHSIILQTSREGKRARPTDGTLTVECWTNPKF